MKTLLRPALSLFVVLTLMTGFLYPLLVTGVSKIAFPDEAAGSIVERDGKPVGSLLIGQNFTDPGHFWGRPSATGPQPNNASNSSGSNLGPNNPALADAVKARIDALRAADPGNTQPVPVELVTASASGLDPHISPAAAEFQVGRVARVRGVDAAKVRELVAQHTEGRQFGVFGEPRVNVLALNLALDAITPRK
jgi:K+-transporting ATPase ATPase C chain